MSYPTLTERKQAKVARMEAALALLERELAAYARQHGGRFILFGSAARGELRHDSDVDIMVDVPGQTGWDAAEFAEDRARGHGLEPDVQIIGMSGPRLRERVCRDGRVLDEASACSESTSSTGNIRYPRAGEFRTESPSVIPGDRAAAGDDAAELYKDLQAEGGSFRSIREETRVRDARWLDVDQDCETAARHFRAGARVFRNGSLTGPADLDRVMALLHYMQSGYTSLESCLLRILAILGEAPPTGPDWHALLITRCATAVPGSRGALLSRELASDAQETRRFRHLAMHGYDVTFEPERGTRAIEAGLRLAEALPRRIEAFAREIDP